MTVEQMVAFSNLLQLELTFLDTNIDICIFSIFRRSCLYYLLFYVLVFLLYGKNSQVQTMFYDQSIKSVHWHLHKWTLVP